MIILRRIEEIALYQVELALKVKTKQSPFIAILILANEIGEISGKSLQKYLLSSLPLRSCENLLKRLEQQGYLEATKNSYQLTEFGTQSAKDESFWIGEKGAYNLYFFNSTFVAKRIVKTEKVEKAESDKENKNESTPNEIKGYKRKIVSINKTEVLFEEIEDNCFHLKPEVCHLELRASGKETILRLFSEKKDIYQTTLDFDEDFIRHELLSTSEDLDYDKDKKVILTSFDKEDLSFKRKVRIAKPFFQKYQFNQVDLEHIDHIPKNKQHANSWLDELLFKGIDQYFLDDISFDEYAKQISSPIKLHYKISIPERNQFADVISERADSFYQIAKLQTIDFLNY